MSVRTQRSHPWGTLVALAGIILMTAAGSGVAHATQSPSSQYHDTVELVKLNEDGLWVSVSIPEPLNLRMPQDEFADPDSDGTTIDPYLVNPAQWTSCFVFNNAAEVFATYYWIQQGLNVELQCGNSSYGYKHIIAQGHDADWTSIYNNAVAAGWTASAYGASSWDDLMNIVLANQLGIGGSFYSENPTSQKACTYSMYGLYNTSTNTIVYTFGSEAVWSMNNLRVISSYPSGRGYCNT